MLDNVLDAWRDVVAYRDVDSRHWQWGVMLNNHALTVYMARRCYRVSWWRP